MQILGIIHELIHQGDFNNLKTPMRFVGVIQKISHQSNSPMQFFGGNSPKRFAGIGQYQFTKAILYGEYTK